MYRLVDVQSGGQLPRGRDAAAGRLRRPLLRGRATATCMYIRMCIVYNLYSITRCMLLSTLLYVYICLYVCVECTCMIIVYIHTH